MTLTPERLDDLTWRGLVDVARGQIAQRSGGAWTLHAPVDPGITLLELFAYLLEQRVYWLDHLPAAFTRAALEHLGVRPREAVAARTVLQIATDGTSAGMASGTVLSMLGAAPELSLTTETPVTALATASVELHTAEGDRSEDLRVGRWVRLFGMDGGRRSARIGLRMTNAPVAVAGHPLALLIELDSEPLGVPSQWDPNAALGVAPPTQLTWSYRTASGRVQWAAADVDDGTGGLRRSGLVRLRIPSDWLAEPGSLAPDGTSRWDVVVEGDVDAYTSAPRVRTLTPNVVIAAHRRRVCVHRLEPRRPLPGNEVVLDAERDLPMLDTMAVYLRERAAPEVWQKWQVVADFGRSGPADRVVIGVREERRLAFGDGIRARVPIVSNIDPSPGAPLPEEFAEHGCPVPGGPNVPNVRIVYDAGGGTRGNVGAGASWLEASSGPSPRRAVNVVDAIGGLDPETLDDARTRAAGELTRVSRAVTAADHVVLAETTPGVAVARAHAEPGFDPAHPCLRIGGTTTVFVVPAAPRGALANASEAVDVGYPMPDAGLLSAVANRLEQHRLAASIVHVTGPRYRPLSVRVTLEGDPFAPAVLRERVTLAITAYFDPLVGGDDGDGWPFGQPIRPSAIARVADRIAGDEARVRAVAIGLDDRATEECRELAIASWELVRVARLDVVLLRPDGAART